MGRILENWRIFLAAVFAVILVGVSFSYTRTTKVMSVAQTSGEAAVLQAIATKDSDGDGLPDWEEVLYGTDAHVIDTFGLGMTDNEAVTKGLIVPKTVTVVPTGTTATRGSAEYATLGLTAPSEGTLTDSFASYFFTNYLKEKQANGGTELTSDQSSALASSAIEELSQTVAPAPDFKQLSDIKISGTGPDAMLSFAVAAEAILKKNITSSTKSDIQYLQAAVEENDTSALESLTSLANSYRNTAIGISVLPVPAELAEVDLAIVNAIMRLSKIYNDFSRVNIDPLSAMLALQQYTQTELSAEQAFAVLATTYKENGIVLKNGTPGAGFVNIMANLSAQQATQKTL